MFVVSNELIKDSYALRRTRRAMGKMVRGFQSYGICL